MRAGPRGQPVDRAKQIGRRAGCRAPSRVIPAEIPHLSRPAESDGSGVRQSVSAPPKPGGSWGSLVRASRRLHTFTNPALRRIGRRYASQVGALVRGAEPAVADVPIVERKRRVVRRRVAQYGHSVPLERSLHAGATHRVGLIARDCRCITRKKNDRDDDRKSPHGRPRILAPSAAQPRV